MDRRSRRYFLASSLLLARLVALGGCSLPLIPVQPAPKIYRLGWLASGLPGDLGFLLEALRGGLRDLGYVEGQNLVIEARWAEGHQERLNDLAVELVHLSTDLIVSHATPAALAAQQATSTIPIVAVAIADPLGSGLVASLAHPGGNLTGLSVSPPELGAKRLELLKQTAPSVSRVAVFWNPDNVANSRSLNAAQEAAPKLGVALLPLPVRSAATYPPAFQQAVAEHVDGALFLAATVDLCCLPQIVSFLVQNRLPAIASTLGDGPEVGGLLSYGTSSSAIYRDAAGLVDQIFQGANPGDLPIEQPTTFDFVINLKAAQAIGLTIPPAVLSQATEVIQ